MSSVIRLHSKKMQRICCNSMLTFCELIIYTQRACVFCGLFCLIQTHIVYYIYIMLQKFHFMQAT